MKVKIRKEHVRGSVKVAPVANNITGKRLKWYGHVKRMSDARKDMVMKTENQVEETSVIKT